MKTDTYTPGPWTNHPPEGRDGWQTVRDSSGLIVANVNPESGIDVSAAPAVRHYPMPDDANARLIAAAPDLLNACCTALEWFRDNVPREHGNPETGAAWGALGRAVEAALGEPVEY